MTINCTFQNKPNKTYEVVLGSVFSDERNEKLDSMKIVLSNIPAEDRIDTLACYERVLIQMGNTAKTMLVDTYVEDFINLNEYYNYTIDLMSETKYLEKIQLPNRMINKSLLTGQKTINEVIHEFIDLYVPKYKAKVETIFTYKQLITFTDKDIFDVPCPYFSWNKPTLRTVLTSLMNVVGCIPIVENRQLKYIDFNEPTTTFDTTGCNYISRSNASDSFVNTLNMQPDNVLDENNYTIVENLGFRDGTKVFLKQTENLKLETRLPIYDINKVNYISPVKNDITMQNGPISANNSPCPALLQVTNVGTIATIRFSDRGDSIGNTKNIVFDNVILNSFHYDSDNKIVYNQTIEIGNITISALTTKNIQRTLDSTPTYLCVNSYNVHYEGEDSSTYVYKIALMDNQYLKAIYFADVSETFDKTSWELDSSYFPVNFVYYRNYTKDVTALFKEKKKRQVLEVNFLQMENDYSNGNIKTTEDMAKYLYGTVEYKVGSKEITGFSKEYTVQHAFFAPEHTYIENISDELFKLDQEGDNFDIAYQFGGIPKIDYLDGKGFVIYEDIVTQNKCEFISGTGTFLKYPLYTSIVFQIEYQPMNSFNIKYPKSNIDSPYIIEQLDSQESSIPQFDDMSIAERNKTDRVGNEVFTINQRVEDFDLIQPLNSLYDGNKIVFKRKISYYEDFAIVQYTASRDYILKNFYTSIVTKYRAYEYSDYEGTVVRKENTLIYCLLDNYYFNGDDKLEFDYNQITPVRMIDGCVEHTEDNRIRYNILESGSKQYKNDLSVISDKNNLLFVYQEYDSNSFGISLKNGYEADEGGITQSWEIMDESYWENHSVYFTNDFEKDSNKFLYTTLAEMESVVIALGEYPLISKDISTTYYIKVNTNFAKYVNEVINHTVQLHFYTNNSRLEWTKHFINSCSLKTETNINLKICVNNNTMSESEYIDSALQIESFSDYITVYGGRNAYIKIDWDKIITIFTPIYLVTIKSIKIVKYLGNNTYIDIIKFTRDTTKTGSERYYLSFNDTKSEKVYLDSSLLQPVGEVGQNILDRSFVEYSI